MRLAFSRRLDVRECSASDTRRVCEDWLGSGGTALEMLALAAGGGEVFTCVLELDLNGSPDLAGGAGGTGSGDVMKSSKSSNALNDWVAAA